MKNFKLLLFVLFFVLVPGLTQAQVSQNVSGYITLQVEESGEAWYIYPTDLQRYYLGRPADAFEIMRELGLGITDADLARIPISSTSWDGEAGLMNTVRGKILLQVEQSGEAWYVYPGDNRRYYLGRPDDAFEIMRNLGLGISNTDLYTIDIGSADSSVVPAEIEDLEDDINRLVNSHRESMGLDSLAHSSDISDVARSHSSDMAEGIVDFGHDGFQDRADAVAEIIGKTVSVGENVAWATARDEMAYSIVEGWLNSAGHRENIERTYFETSGIGISVINNKYYFTQLFSSL